MICTPQYTNTNRFMQQDDVFFDANLDLDFMDGTGLFDAGPTSLFTFDDDDVLFESSETYGKPLDTETHLSLTFARRLSITPPTHEDQEYQEPVSPPAILSLLTAVQLELQLEETKARLAESMERSAMSRKRLNDEVDCTSPEEQYARRDSFKAQRSNSAPSSVLSQSRAQYASYISRTL
jgi:hypothetical protein